MITGVYAGLREDLEMAKVDCLLRLDPSLPQVRIDYKKMAYCIRSILTNSLEALPEGGRIEVRTERCGDRLQVVLADNGPGMSQEMIRQITTPFFSSKEKGTGLGLSLCARILEGHGADFEIQSAEGYGTTFIIRLKSSEIASSETVSQGDRK